MTSIITITNMINTIMINIIDILLSLLLLSVIARRDAGEGEEPHGDAALLEALEELTK